jgi:galactosyl transferase GMA12/MNN10 family
VRKALCSIGAGPHVDLLALSGETFGWYAERHGYELELRTELLVPDRPPAWSKIPLIQGLLEDHDLVLWVDADAAIVDPTLDLADELGPRRLMGLVAHRYDGQVVPNCGVWALRRHRRVRRFLDELWANVAYLDHKWWENAALIEGLGYSVEPRVEPIRRSRMRDRTQYLDRSWNSIAADPADRPRINHYPGRSQEQRRQALEADVATAREVLRSLAHPSAAG